VGFLFFTTSADGSLKYPRHSMKTNATPLATRFAPETRFEVTPVELALPYGPTLQFERLRSQLLRTWLSRTPDPTRRSRLGDAQEFATALARQTGFPLLVYPLLFEEAADRATDAGVEADDDTRRLSVGAGVSYS